MVLGFDLLEILLKQVMLSYESQTNVSRNT